MATRFLITNVCRTAVATPALSVRDREEGPAALIFAVHIMSTHTITAVLLALAAAETVAYDVTGYGASANQGIDLYAALSGQQMRK